MPHDVIAICPVCASDLAVTRLHRVLHLERDAVLPA